MTWLFPDGSLFKPAKAQGLEGTRLFPRVACGESVSSADLISIIIVFSATLGHPVGDARAEDAGDNHHDQENGCADIIEPFR